MQVNGEAGITMTESKHFDPPETQSALTREVGNRRDLVKGIIVALASSVGGAFLTVDAKAALPTTEGVFLIAPDAKRIFFIRSAYLPYFEVTDRYSSTELDNVVSVYKNHGKKEKWSVLYSDDYAGDTQPENGDNLSPPANTYIAMSLSPPI
jgi:hypothetical protein